MEASSLCNAATRCKRLCLFSILNGRRRTFGGMGRLMSSSGMEATESDEHIPVLIVGAGPVGLILSILLTKLGVKCSVIERSQHFSQHPQAHFINNRTMEVFRKLDGLAGEIEELQPPVEQWRKFVYCTTLSGPILGIVDHLQPQDFDQTRSPTSVAHFSQHRLVPLLLKRLERLGFSLCSGSSYSNDELQYSASWVGKIKFGHECVHVRGKATSN